MTTNDGQPALLDRPLRQRPISLQPIRLFQARSRRRLVFVACLIAGAISGAIWPALLPHTVDATNNFGAGLELDQKTQRTDLTRQKSELDRLFQDLNRELGSLKQFTWVLLQEGENEALSVALQSSKLNETLHDAQQRTLESRSLLVSVQSALASGGDLQPYLRQIVGESLTSSKPDAELRTKLLASARQRLRRDGAMEETLHQLIQSVDWEANGLKQHAAGIESAESKLNTLLAQTHTFFQQQTEVDSHLDLDAVFDAPAKRTASASGVVIASLIGLLAGAIAAACLISLWDFAKDQFRSIDEIVRRTGLPVLAVVEESNCLSGYGVNSIAAVADPDSRESESFRAIANSLAFASMEARRLMMTSADPEAGKTTIVVNLAVAFAQANQKTLLIDADFQRAQATQLLGLTGPRGLSQILSDTHPVIESCLENVFNLGIEGLDVMPAGSCPENLSGLLAGNRFDLIISWAASQYDRILFDVPPVLQTTDIELIGRAIESALVVVRPETSRRRSVRRVIDSCRSARIPVVGVIVNHTDDVRGPIDETHPNPISEDDGHHEVVEDRQKPRIAA